MSVPPAGRDEVVALFAASFGRAPAVVASAPGRVNLIGEHVDYNGGAVLPIAIAQRTWVALGAAPGRTSRAVSRERGDAAPWDASYTAATGAWWDYVVGAIDRAAALGGRPHGHDVAVLSDVPVGAGLSSSAALEAATVLGALALEGIAVARDDEGSVVPRHAGSVTLRDVALRAHEAETGFVGVACGIMDQFASALCRAGHALHLQCDTGTYAHVPFTRGVLIVDTGAPRALRASAFNDRQAECRSALELLRRFDPSLHDLAHATPDLLQRAALPDPEARRARHVVQETRRVAEFVQRCEAGDDWNAFGQLLNRSHRSLRDDYECSSMELDWIAEHSVARVGIDGARLTGAGWGGCAIVVGDREALEEFAPDLERSFELSWGRLPSTWLTAPSAGARVEQ